MKFTITAILLCTVTFTHAQTSLSKRQVYDFAPGDIFMTKYTVTDGSRGRTDYRLDTIVSILQNAADTFTYVTSSFIFHHDFVWPDSVYKGHMYFYDTITITELDSSAKHIHYCPTCSDTIASNALFCDALTWTISTDLPDYHLRSHLVEGLGGPYYYWSRSTPSMIAVYNDLIFYHKAGTECGEIVTSNHDIDDHHNLALYPNPADQFIILEGAAFSDQLTIFSMDGIKLLETVYTGQPVNIAGFPPGIYILQLRSSLRREQVFRFIRQ